MQFLKNSEIDYIAIHNCMHVLAQLLTLYNIYGYVASYPIDL